ncbi:MAG: hypothetical protein ACO1SV_23425 [Fimbriimonas sp.]
MVGRLIILIAIVAAILGFVAARLILLPLWKKTQEACRARDRAIEAEEERLRQEAEEKRQAEKELASLLHCSEEPMDRAQARQGNE